MKRLMMVAALPMLFGAACSTTIEKERINLDASQLASCPRSVESPGDLPAYEAAGPEAVSRASALAREALLVAGALAFRGAWLECRSAVVYVEDVTAK